ncbi:hypothetical protein KW842_00545 [Duganella sp. sic0402]|uniref:hypothetical protein n=1 Tax=Duganella sp. sic0402 TaxID=2854786 RepID=UPI001C473F94|nr:hypothetical protein [Duganella sp. sic0402]MBV7534242.1 hypothetical protein [Duganella sp. sic0402]
MAQKHINNVLSYAIGMPAQIDARRRDAHHKIAQRTTPVRLCRRTHKIFLMHQISSVVKKCRTANNFCNFYAAKSIAACGKSRFLTAEE